VPEWKRQETNIITSNNYHYKDDNINNCLSLVKCITSISPGYARKVFCALEWERVSCMDISSTELRQQGQQWQGRTTASSKANKMKVYISTYSFGYSLFLNDKKHVRNK